MARDRKQRPEKIVYNHDGTIITETASTNDEVQAERRSSYLSSTRVVEIPVLDVFDAYATYTQFWVGGGKSSCAICGIETQYDGRKICRDCMKQHKVQLQEKTESALELGDRTVSIEVVE